MGNFISPDLYRYIYLGLTAILVILFTIDYKSSKVYKTRYHGYYKTLILGIFFIIYFGTRPIYGATMGDTSGYVSSYLYLRKGVGLFNVDTGRNTELVWLFILNTMRNIGCHVSMWFTVIAFIYIMFNIWGVRRIFPNRIYPAFLFYVVFFMFYSGGINGVRNADAYSIVFCAISLYTKPSLRNYILMAALFILGFQIHSSVIATIAAFLLARFVVKKTNTAILIWLTAIILSLVAGNYLANHFAVFFGDDRAERYLMNGSNRMIQTAFSHTGFRWDFLIFSSLPIAIGWYVTIKRRIADKFYVTLLNTYILANAVWVVFIYAAYSNRFAMLSWCIYPYVLCYPFLNMKLFSYTKQTRFTCILLWIQFIFTYYMSFK